VLLQFSTVKPFGDWKLQGKDLVHGAHIFFALTGINPYILQLQDSPVLLPVTLLLTILVNCHSPSKAGWVY
jgi:hypothetical protein